MFDQFGGIDVGDEDRRVERLIDFFHERQAAVAVAADDDAVGLHQIGHGAAFAQEFGIADHIEVGVGVVALDRIGDFLAGFDRHRAFIHDDAVFIWLENTGDLAGYPFDKAQVHAAVRLRGRRHGDEDDLGVIDALFDAVGETKPFGGDVALHKLFEPRFINGDSPGKKGIHFPLVVINTNDVVTDFGETRAAYETDIS